MLFIQRQTKRIQRVADPHRCLMADVSVALGRSAAPKPKQFLDVTNIYPTPNMLRSITIVKNKSARYAFEK